MSGHPDTFQYTLSSLVSCWLTLIPRVQKREAASEISESVLHSGRRNGRGRFFRHLAIEIPQLLLVVFDSLVMPKLSLV